MTHAGVSDAFAEYEAQRKEKLHAAKRERMKLKQTEQRLQWQDKEDTPVKRLSSLGIAEVPMAATQLPEKVSMLVTCPVNIIKP